MREQEVADRADLQKFTNIKNCKTCTKITKNKKRCTVLRIMIGEESDCWAYSNDPGWEAKVQEAVKMYSGLKIIK